MSVSPLLRRSLRRATSRLSTVKLLPLQQQRSWSTLKAGPSSLTVDTLKATFPYIWLRDSCQSPECIHPTASQKLHKSSDIPLDIKPTEDGVRLLDDGIAIEWTDGHKSHFSIAFLERHSSPAKLAAFHKQVASEPWNNQTISQTRDLFVPYGSLKTPSGLLAALQQISRYGLLFVHNVPHLETSDDTCELPALAAIFGYIRTTFYGRLFDVKALPNSTNLAFTNLDTGLHMDLLYLEHPPRYQLLHCLRNRVHGGHSLFVDGAHCASSLLRAHPADFALLARTPVPFHYINNGHHFHSTHPTIALAPASSGAASDVDIAHVNYGPGTQAPLPLSTPAAFYAALARFAGVLHDPSNVFRCTLREGDAVIFDNRRVLHSRTAFSDIVGGQKRKRKGGETSRWLKGCYLEADDLLDRRRVLEAQRMIVDG